MAKVTRIGVDEMMRDLAKLAEGDVVTAVGVPALQVGGNAAVAIAQGTAPRRTGRFADSIHVEGGATQGDWSPAAGEKSLEPPAATKTSVAIAVGSTLWYGRFVEFGTSKMPPRRPVGNAVDAVDQVVKDALDHYMRAWLGGLGLD